ncbi:MAG TPA: nucleotide exchange factor GrpE [Vicinamibacterales bacterium]|nr:nucleotide exchange factor GrpE [Vicinamibacterales bacterium]
MADEPDVKVVDRRWWARAEGPLEAEEPVHKPTYVEELERQLAERDALVRSYAEKYREAAAGFDEARARLRRETGKEIERARRAVLVELLDVLDNLDRAVEAARRSLAGGEPSAQTAAALVEGVELVRQQFLAKLESFGVRRIDAAGRPFDPERHDAVATIPAASPEEANRVVEVVTHGYAIGDEVLRPARVVVAKADA